MKILKYIYIYILLTICLFSSCSEEQKQQMEEHHIKCLKEDIPEHIYKIQYENHTYIVLYYGYKGGITHDPDCKCKSLE